MSGLKLAFAGTPDLAAVVLQALIDHPQHQVECVFTQPDRPAGRGKKIRQSAVKQLAVEHGLAIEQPHTSAEIDVARTLSDIDVMVVVAYGCLLKENVFSYPRFGALNIHTSLLPRWRGAAPIQRAIEAGDEKTGVSIMQIDAGMDTGPILLQKECGILSNDTSGILHDRLARLGAEAIVETLDLLENGSLTAEKQDDEFACHAAKISKQEALIDWNEPAATIDQKIRAFNPAPVAHGQLANKDMRIWQAQRIDDHTTTAAAGKVLATRKDGIDVACGRGILRIQKLQLPGKKPVSAEQFLNGHPEFPE